MKNTLLCIDCQKEVATYSKIEGITTWFAICSECKFNVRGWNKKRDSILMNRKECTVFSCKSWATHGFMSMKGRIQPFTYCKVHAQKMDDVGLFKTCKMIELKKVKKNAL